MALYDGQDRCSAAAAAAAFAEFLQEREIGSWFLASSVRANLIAQFGIYLIQTGRKPSTATTYCFAIFRLYLAIGIGNDPYEDRQIVGLVTSRFKRTQMPSTFQRHPIPRDIIVRIAIDESVDIAIRAGCLTAWNSCLRLGELLRQKVDGKQGPIPYKALAFNGAGYAANIFRKSSKWEPISHDDAHLERNPAAVPSNGLFLRLLAERPPAKHWSPFVVKGKRGYRNLSAEDLVKAVKQEAEKGRYQLNLRGHSFRIGVATEAYRLGLSEEGVRALGSWSSDAFKTYVRPHLAANLLIGHYSSSGFPTTSPKKDR